jgi:exodeoxyribonuclease VII large subunit
MEHTILQVSDLLALVNQTLEYAYPSVVVEGEVASFKVSKGKFVFFDIKDDTGSVNCFMMTYSLRQPLEDGMRVQIVAQPRLTNWGKFSLTVREVRPVGEGSIKRAFELLRTRLQKEGLFDPARKRLLPRIPRSVGLIASVESAGYADFIKILNHRWGGVDITVANVQVQGMGAAEQIIGAIRHFNEAAEPPEVLVLVRGGGSADDLSVFNDEQLVRALAASRVPTLVGVGHEVDVSLADLVADVRAATPSNAAQILVPDRHALLAELAQREQRLAERLAGRAVQVRRTVDTASLQMIDRMERVLRDHTRHVAQAEQLLRQLDPKMVLRRGYSLVRGETHTLIRDAHDVKLGETLTITTAHAIIRAGVIDAKQK